MIRKHIIEINSSEGIKNASDVCLANNETDGRIGTLYNTQYFQLRRQAVEFPDGKIGRYNTLRGKHGYYPAVAMLPIFNNMIVLLKQHRFPLNATVLEMPRGFGTPGLTTAENARKELLEELGTEPTYLESLGIHFIDSGMSDLSVELFFCEINGLGESDPNEGIEEVVLISKKEFRVAVANGTIQDGFTLAAYARASSRSLI